MLVFGRTKAIAPIGCKEEEKFEPPKREEEMTGMVVVVFDFDKTIIDCDSDNWVVKEFMAAELFHRLRPTLPWNSLMDRMMWELHSQGRTTQEIAKCLTNVPLDPHIVTAIKSAYALGCELRVVSDANQFFIETILNHHGLIGCFSEISTNPIEIDGEGRLRILPYHDFTASSHGCSLCPPNMCKGKIIERIRASASTNEKKRFIYLGDGRGDYCPSIKLSDGDCVMPRKNYPLWDLICKNGDILKAEVHEWSNGEELERVLLQLINRRVSPGRGDAGMDCKFPTEALPHALPVPQ